MTRRVRVMVVVLLALAAACVAFTRLPSSDPDEALQIVVSPHPDDELQGWAAIRSDDAGLYTVFVLMTRGEATGNCNGAPGLDRAAGERVPRPLPGARDKGTDMCKAARIDSWNRFLDATADTVHGDRLADMRTAPGPVETWVGRHSARIIIGVPDGKVTPQAVEDAIGQVRALRGDLLPDLPVRRLVSTAYWSDSPEAGDNRAPCPPERPCPGDPRDFEYEHPDHLAVTRGVTAAASLADDGAWIVTGRHARGEKKAYALSPRLYERFMGLDRAADPEDPRRTGAQQVEYGWLSFPGRFWSTGEYATSRNDVLFPRVQYVHHVRNEGRP